MRTRILIYGGTELTLPQQRLVKTVVGRLLQKYSDVVILSGGFWRWKPAMHPDRVDWFSVDRVVRETVVRIAGGTGNHDGPLTRLETWLSDRDLDRDDVDRYYEHAQYLSGSSDQARRFKLVTKADAILTVSGEGNTATVLELAMTIERPTLPIACTGGDSKMFWDNHRDWFRDSLSPHANSGLDDTMLARLADPATLESDDSIDKLAVEIADTIYGAALKRCLVLMPFDEGDTSYDEVIAPAVSAAGYVPDRLDRLATGGDIREIFRDRLSRSHHIVIDVTGANPNVMFELGYVWATSDKKPLLILRRPLDERAFDALPFYLKPLHIVNADGNTPAGQQELARWITSFLGGQDRDQR